MILFNKIDPGNLYIGYHFLLLLFFIGLYIAEGRREDKRFAFLYFLIWMFAGFLLAAIDTINEGP